MLLGVVGGAMGLQTDDAASVPARAPVLPAAAAPVMSPAIDEPAVEVEEQPEPVQLTPVARPAQPVETKRSKPVHRREQKPTVQKDREETPAIEAPPPPDTQTAESPAAPPATDSPSTGPVGESTTVAPRPGRTIKGSSYRIKRGFTGASYSVDDGQMTRLPPARQVQKP